VKINTELSKGLDFFLVTQISEKIPVQPNPTYIYLDTDWLVALISISLNQGVKVKMS